MSAKAVTAQPRATSWNGVMIRDGSPAFTKRRSRTQAREAQQERTLARFLGHDADLDASCPNKPPMESEWLRTGVGPCHICQTSGPIFLYEIDPLHREYLNCGHCDWGSDYQLCDVCAASGSKRGQVVNCAYEGEIEDPCYWARWLTTNCLPWLCGSCWRHHTDLEAAHVAELHEMEE
jgi:hypothetical protein